MSNLNKTLIAAAITGMMAMPSAYAVDANVFSKSSAGSIKVTGDGCKALKEKKLDTELYVDSAFEGGPNTGEWEMSMFLFSEFIDAYGPLVASNKGRTLNMDLYEVGYWDLEDFMDAYSYGDLENDGCKNSDGLNFGDTVINKFETKLSKNGSKAKLKMEAEGTYYDYEKDKDRKIKVMVKTTQMDGID